MYRHTLLALFILFSSKFTFAQIEVRTLENVSEAVVQHLENQEFDQIPQYFDTKLEDALPAVKVKIVWLSLLQQKGDYQGNIKTTITRKPGDTSVTKTLQFEQQVFDLKMKFDPLIQIKSFILTPSRVPRQDIAASRSEAADNKPKIEIERYGAPGYDYDYTYTEEDIKIKSGRYKLPGKLTLPKNGDKLPVVILVHGSGPSDMDESIGPNKFFKDLAAGLASKGIAVIRYDKRTFVYGEKSAPKGDITVQEETVEDALAAVELAKKEKRIDPDKIYIIGHSLGGMLAPRIAQGSPEVDGIIMMAANARPLQELLAEQATYLLERDGSLSESDKRQLETLQAQIKNTEKGTLNADTKASELPLSLPASYWMDLNTYDQVATAKNLEIPVLVMHARRDYQVTDKDYEIWQKELDNKPNAKVVAFPWLNHLFMTGEGKATPEEYQKAGHVEEYVIKEIAEWIKAH